MSKVATILQTAPGFRQKQRQVANFFLVTASGLTLVHWSPHPCLSAGAGRSPTELTTLSMPATGGKSLPTAVDTVRTPTQILLARVDRFLLVLGQFKGVLRSLLKVPGTFYNPSCPQKYTDGQQTLTVSHHPRTSLVLAHSPQAVPLREPSLRHPFFLESLTHKRWTCSEYPFSPRAS